MFYSSNINVFSGALDAKISIESLIQEGKTVVTTNGCFDILHAGHVQYLMEASSLGDILLVGINADSVVKKLKGDHRPIQPEADRAQIIASLKMVYGSFIFNEDDPRNFISIIKPNIHVKGGDYTEDILEKDVVEQNGGIVKIVSFLKGRSTSGYVKKMQVR